VAKPCASIAEAIAQPEGTAVQVTDQVVTAGSESFTDRFYIESSDRACGVGVQLASGQLPARDRLVQVVGVVGSVDGEERLLNAAVTTGAGVPSPSPLGMTGRGLASSGAPGQGLLIKAWGTVTYVAPDSSFFLMDDGSGVPGVAGRNGLKVACEGTVAGISPPAVGQFVIVTGVRGRENNGTVAVLRPRGPEDIVTR
jgi:hypothetical protein